MSNRVLPPPFISEPPIYDDLINDDKKIHDSWINWFNSITRVMGYNIVHDYIIDPATDVRDDINLLQAPSLTTTQRDQLENARNGTIIYNLTTDRFNLREGGAWVTFTAIPA